MVIAVGNVVTMEIKSHIYHTCSLKFTRQRSRATVLHQPNDILIRESIEMNWNYKRYGESLQRGTVINGIKSGKIEKKIKLVYNLKDRID